MWKKIKGSARPGVVIALVVAFLLVGAGIVLGQVMQGASFEAGGTTKGIRPVKCLDDGTGRYCTLQTQSPVDAKTDDDSITNCDDLNTSGENYTVPTQGDMYEIRVTGNCASILCGASDPAATVGTAKNAHYIKVCDGVPHYTRINSAVCAHIAPTVEGEICYVHKNSAL